MLKKRNRGENQEGVSDISPTLQESQNKILTIDWSDFVYWFQLFIIQICTLMDDSTFASRKSSLRAYALLVLTPRYTVWLKPHDQSLYEIHKRSHDPEQQFFKKPFSILIEVAEASYTSTLWSSVHTPADCWCHSPLSSPISSHHFSHCFYTEKALAINSHTIYSQPVSTHHTLPYLSLISPFPTENNCLQ